MITAGKEIVQDVTVLNKFSVGSNYRIVTAEFVLNTRAKVQNHNQGVNEFISIQNDPNECVLSMRQ